MIIREETMHWSRFEDFVLDLVLFYKYVTFFQFHFPEAQLPNEGTREPTNKIRFFPKRIDHNRKRRSALPEILLVEIQQIRPNMFRVLDFLFQK